MFAQTRNKLKPDGFFLASVFGEETLYQLRWNNNSGLHSYYEFKFLKFCKIFRTSLLLATQERRGAVAQYLSPFAGLGDIGNLLTRTKFALPTGLKKKIDLIYFFWKEFGINL